jgi:hypothetical protein
MMTAETIEFRWSGGAVPGRSMTFRFRDQAETHSDKTATDLAFGWREGQDQDSAVGPDFWCSHSLALVGAQR